MACGLWAGPRGCTNKCTLLTATTRGVIHACPTHAQDTRNHANMQPVASQAKHNSTEEGPPWPVGRPHARWRPHDLRDLCAQISVSLHCCRVWNTCALQTGSGERGCDRKQLTAPGLQPHSIHRPSKRPHHFCNLCAHNCESLRCCRVWNTCALRSGSEERGCEREQLTAPGLPPHSRPMFSKRPHDFCNLCAHKSDSLRCCRVWNTCALQIVLG